MKITLSPKNLLSGKIDIISSKSDIHRCIICAALSDSPTEISFCGLSKDILTTVECVKTLGAAAEFSDGKILVTPIDRSKIRQGIVFDCGESGSTSRFLLPIAAAVCRNASFVGAGRLPERPFSQLCASLLEHGAVFTSEHIPTTITNGIESGGIFNIPGNISSQYISGLLLMLPLLDCGGRVHITTPLESQGYVNMTVDTLSQFGINVQRENDDYVVPAHSKYTSPGKIRAQGDWSSAAFWLCADALGASVEVVGLDINASQGDKQVVEILERFGARKVITPQGIAMEAGRLHAIDIDAHDIPDLVPALAVVASAARGTTHITGAARLRLKESDRLETTRDMLSSLGADIAVTDDGLIINGMGKLDGGNVDGHNDHRIVMSAAIASLICRGQVVVDGAQAAEKSYTTFFDDFDALTMKG